MPCFREMNAPFFPAAGGGISLFGEVHGSDDDDGEEVQVRALSAAAGGPLPVVHTGDVKEEANVIRKALRIKVRTHGIVTLCAPDHT